MASLPTLIKSAGKYTASHPRVLGDIARHAFGRRLAIPLDLLRWATTMVPESQAKDLTVLAQPPAIGVGATANLMGTELRVDGAITFESIDATTDSVRIAFKVGDLRASVLNNLQGNLAKLLASGVINLKKPASLLNFVPKKPPFLVEAKDDRFVLELMKVPKLAQNPRFQKALAAITPVFQIAQIRTEDDLLIIGLNIHPRRIFEAIQAIFA
ncbi:MAG: hypothetical protein U1F43_39170 [Myxococcota bacterium]